MKSKVFIIAHQVKQYFTNFSDALKAAWRIVKLFLGYPIHLTFAKETGEIREADALAIGGLSTLESGFFRFVEAIDGRTQWRSCRLDRMVL